MADSAGAGPGCLDRLKGYVRTQKGTILAAEIIISFIILICYAASSDGSFSAVAVCKMVLAMLFFGIFMMEIDKQFQMINWVWSDLFRAGVGTLLYIITSLICVFKGAGDGARMAGGVLGLFAGILFAYDTYTIFLQIKGTRQHTAASTDDTA